jgi:hypothetical protein
MLLTHVYFLISCRLIVDWQLARNEAGESEGTESVKAPNDEDRFDESDTDVSLSDNQATYIKTRSGGNKIMAQKKDQ